MKAALALMLCATLTLGGCTIPRLTTRTLQAEDRIVTGVERQSTIEGLRQNVRIICPEPSPDALKAIAASGSLSKADILAISGAYQESGANIGLRTQSIQLLRDQLYSMCQSYANGVIDRNTYMMYLTRNQRNTVAILAIEQLTGVTKGSIATVTGSSSATLAAQDVQKQTKLLEAAKANLKTLDANSAQAKDLQKLIDDEQTKVDKANAALASAIANGTATNAPSTTQLDATAISKVAETVQEIAELAISVNDIYYLCFNAYQSQSIGLMPISFRTACDTAFKNQADATLAPVTPAKESASSSASGDGGKKVTNPTPPAKTPRPGGPIWQSM